MADGRTTEIPVGELPQYYVGNPLHYISFRHMIIPKLGKVAVHSEIHDADGRRQDFLYEVVERHEALDCAETMVEDATAYLASMGVAFDMNATPLVFLERLSEELHGSLH